jgi:hypothetical protein
MIFMRRIAIAVTAALATMLFATAIGMPAVPPAGRDGAKRKPADVVKEYCQLDLQGARLSGETWSRVAPLVGWEDEPGWDSAILASGYHVQSTTVRPDHASVIVVFRVLGSLEDDKPFAPARKGKYETISFHLERAGDSWKIVRPVIPPHVSLRSMMEHLRGLLAHEENGSERKQTLEEQLHQLEKLHR